MQAMQDSEIINRIIKAEKRAMEMEAEARAKREGFEDSLRAELLELRDIYIGKAEIRIGEYRTQEERSADEEIARMEDECSRELERLENYYREKGEELAAAIFAKVISRGEARA